jgi:sulfate/thiosulfate transport system substrate-binding protein
VTLVLAAYSAPREVFDKRLIPGFAARTLAETGKRVRVETSYLGSGAQARAVAGGFEADVAVFALAPDLDRLAQANLLRGSFRSRPHGGVVATTLVAFAVRPGNPKGILDWADLARPGVEVLMPSPKTSGGAMWNVDALYGAALRGHAGVPPGDPTAAAGFLRAVLRNVLLLDKGARESMITFEKGVGDVALTYESEIVAGRLAGRSSVEVLPASTLLVETPAAVVDVYADKHGVRPFAEAFVAYLGSPEAQRAFGEYGFRAVAEPGEAGPGSPPAALPALPADLFRVDDLGGWTTVIPLLYGPGGAFPRAWEEVTAE